VEQSVLKLVKNWELQNPKAVAEMRRKGSLENLANAALDRKAQVLSSLLQQGLPQNQAAEIADQELQLPPGPVQPEISPPITA
jgi:hypothetical protein